MSAGMSFTQVDIAGGAAAKPAEIPADFDDLVRDILANPERVLDPSLTDEQILEVQKRINPYAGVAGAAPTPGRKRVACVSYTNLRENYIRRFTATSLVGFLFQVLQEWEVPAESRRWTPPRAETAPEPFAAADLVGRLETALAIAKEAADAAEAATAAQRAAAEEEIVVEGAPANPGEKYAEADFAAAKAAGLLYAATHTAHRIGQEAGLRLRATAEAGMRYPEVKVILSQRPLPPAPSSLEVPPAIAKEIINGFLRNWLEFDPSVHVRSGHDAATIAPFIKKTRAGAAGETASGESDTTVDTADPLHLTLEALRAAPPQPAANHKEAVSVILASPRAFSAVSTLLHDENLVEAALVVLGGDGVRGAAKTIFANPRATAAISALVNDENTADAALVALGDSASFRSYLFPVPVGSPVRPAADIVPPQDTFHRWAYYTEVNYDAIRTVTEALYPDRPDLDWALALWDTFEGTEEEVDAEFKKYCKRYADEVPSALKTLEFGAWSLLADFKQNRKNIDFYNAHTEVLRRILDRHAEDTRLGGDLMRNRVRQAKARNIATEGPDAPGLSAYKRSVAEKGQALTGKGVEKVISAEEMRRLEKANGSIKAAQELEVLEQLEKTIADLTDLEKLRPLTEAEARDLTAAKESLEKAREMIAVPDDAIQVDVFTSDPSTGQFTKSHFYTQAEGPAVPAEAGAATATATEHPAARASGAAAAMRAGATAAPERPLAPYAAELLRADFAARTDAERKAEAMRDSAV